MKDKSNDTTEDPLLSDVYDYLTKFDFPLAYVIQRKFKIGFSRAERILRQIEEKKKGTAKSKKNSVKKE